MFRKLVAAAVLTVVVTTASSAMTIREFKKFTIDEQSIYIGAQVSMLVYAYATEGNTGKARCIQHWYYGEPGKETPGPRAVTVELAVAEERGPEKYEVEGIILGLTDQVCGQSKSVPPPPR